jgi:hypothetical protein
LKKPPRRIISPICFQLYLEENGNEDSSSKHIRGAQISLKTSKDSHVNLEVSIVVKIFEIYLVTQSLSENATN